MITSKIIQIIIGVLLIVLSIYLIYSSTNMPAYFLIGTVSGMGCVFTLWGIREVIGGLF